MYFCYRYSTVNNSA